MASGDVSERKLIESFKGHTALVCHVEFAPDLRLAVSASRDDTARLWRLLRVGEEPGQDVRPPEPR